MKLACLILLLATSAPASLLYDTKPPVPSNVTMQWDALAGQLTPNVRTSVTFPQAVSVDEIGLLAYFNPVYPYSVFPGAPLIMTLDAYDGTNRVWQAPEIEFAPPQGSNGPFPIYFASDGSDGPLVMLAGQTLSIAASFAAVQPYQSGGKWAYSTAGFYLADGGGLAMEMFGNPGVNVCEPGWVVVVVGVCGVMAMRTRP